MNLFNSNNIIKISAIVLGFLLGIAGAFLYYFSILPAFTITNYFIFGISILVLILFFISTFITTRPSCQARKRLLSNATYSLFAILGTIITTLIAISTTLIPLNVLFAILVGIIIFFFILTLSVIPLTIYSLLTE